MKDYRKKGTQGPYLWQACLWLAVFILFTVMISHPSVTSSWVFRGCAAALKGVLPSTFPYLVLSSLLVSSGFCDYMGKRLAFLSPLFNIPPSCISVIIVSLICGFPVGGAMISSIYINGQCSKEQAERMAAFCNFCGPPYLFSMFGGVVMNDFRAGVVAFLVQLVMGLLLGVILGKLCREKWREGEAAEVKPDFALSRCFCDAVCNGGRSIVNIFAYIIFFSSVCSVIDRLLPVKSPALRGLIFGLFEMSNGMNIIGGQPVIRYFLGCFIIYFSGISVHLQVMSTLDKDISPKTYLLSRIVFAPVCSLLSTLVYYLITL